MASPITASDTLGCFTIGSPNDGTQEGSQDGSLILRMCNIAGAIPLLSIGAACFRVYCVIKAQDPPVNGGGSSEDLEINAAESQGDKEYTTGAKVAMLVRAFFEAIGLGLPILLLVDLPMDIYRGCAARQEQDISA